IYVRLNASVTGRGSTSTFTATKGEFDLNRRLDHAFPAGRTPAIGPFALHYPIVAIISLMPGPVEIDHQVQKAFRQPPLSHRSAEFIRRFEGVRATLARMTGAKHVALLNGSGTLGNEAVASCLEGPGVVLVNGEFGARIARQAARWN